MSNFELRAEPRSVVGKKVRFLRRQGVVPANVYGQSASTPVQVGAKDVEQTIRRAGRTHLVSLSVGSEKTTVLVKDWQRHPYKGELLHVDFVRVAMNQTMRIDVPVRLVGEAPAVKTLGGMALQSHATVNVECLPADLPEAIEVDITGLAEIDASIYVRDLTAPQGVTILTDGDDLVVKIMAPTVEVEEAAEAPVTAEIGEGAEAEGESE
ncbi:MAG: 50S ribosomal protein L25 [Chloroflexi bacterium]|nr:50S ribosomal protein L25 [Chloroflexota bacterium]